jgi:hypothetical protein
VVLDSTQHKVCRITAELQEVKISMARIPLIKESELRRAPKKQLAAILNRPSECLGLIYQFNAPQQRKRALPEQKGEARFSPWKPLR